MAAVEKRKGRMNPGPGRTVIGGSILGLIIVLLIAGVLFVSQRDAITAFLGPARPDVIILVVADALRADRLSCLDGYTAIQTPNLDSLARDGVLYRHACAPAAWTKPSVATMLTSLYPSTHRALCFDDTLPDPVLTLPEILATHEYHTVGFNANINLFPKFNFQQGFDEYYALDPDQSSQVFEGKTYYQEAALVNQQVLPWLEANYDKPGTSRFFMYIHYMDPHWPYFEHPYTGEDHDVRDPARPEVAGRKYDGEIAYFDQHFGDLIATLKRLGLYDRALIIFTSDHGEEFYDHQGWDHALTLYEEITAVPLIIKYPGNARAGTVDEGLARLLDITPTVLDVAGIPATAMMQGVSLRLPADSPTRAQFSFAETFCQFGALSWRTPRYKLIEVIDGDLRGREPTQLYDLELDPKETTNLAAARPDVVRQLRADMSRTMARAERAAMIEQKAELDPEFRERLRRLGY